MTCWLAVWGVSERGAMTPCDGRIVRAHLIPRRVILRELASEIAPAVIDDPRSWVPACGGPMGNGGHHGQFDWARSLRIPATHLPSGVWVLAETHGLTWWLEREYRGGRA